ncbi:MAG: hypothetical protein QM621_00640 [Aeromicrobium sp.]|uniref:hypothetical protein n=1 Tax=Aeromicrobium sp. TaxID=1871063 RepID=UPI0039E2CE91
MIVADSALKHGITAEAATAAAQSSLAGGPLDHENPQRELRVGLDDAGRLLEIVVLLWDDGEVEIIHAMKARAAYRKLVTGQRGRP